MVVDGGALATDMLADHAPSGPDDYLRAFGYDPPPLDRRARSAEPLIAEINHGIWIAPCPCGAEGLPSPGGVVFFDDPVIWCVRCENVATGGAWRPLMVPEPGLRVAVEAVLRCRPHTEHRNWSPSETVDDLIQQNLERGDSIPDLPRERG